jgi:hypothetical protein
MMALTCHAGMVRLEKKFLPTGPGESPPVGYFILGAF